MDSSDPKYQRALAIVKRLQGAGHRAVFVGGAVRNWLLGPAPKDYDVATSARPEEVLRFFPNSLTAGAHFGVVLVIDGGTQTEVATFRSDGEYLDYRHPTDVHFSTPEADARRRDFTINALFYDPIADEVLDYVGGRKDLEKRLLRAIGNPEDRFSEDALRLLRAVRFAMRFDLKIEPKTRKAIVRAAPLLERISAERVRDELTAILTGPHPGRALRMTSDLGLVDVALPEVAAMRGIPQPPDFHPEGDVFEHVARCLDALPPSPTPALAFGLLLHDVGKPPTFEESDRIRFNRHAKVGAEMAEAICRRLRFSNDQRRRIVRLVADHMRFMDVPRMRRSTLRRFMAKPHFEEDLELHRADCLASHRNLDNYEFCLRVLGELAAESQAPTPPPLVTGDDLIALGLKPGPPFKKILREIHDLQLDGSITTREEALAQLKEIADSQ
ncbi:MAG: CCA tRNA nucleotidyltransferase [Candidatus Sumerlaeota bacterium]|nr:CCA tRNA nucleotidyltransferase [Candidatus Sumerlaeota bacterium]